MVSEKCEWIKKRILLISKTEIPKIEYLWNRKAFEKTLTESDVDYFDKKKKNALDRISKYIDSLIKCECVKKNPVVKLKDPKRAIGETGQVYYPQKKKWIRGKIIGISDIRRAPFFAMSGYSEIPIYKVKLYTGEVIETSPIMMREFRHRKLKSNPLIEYYKKEVNK
jgi:hypothetical protein